MKLTVFGAAQEVTGSCYLIECGSSRVIVDFGVYQGKDDDRRNSAPLPFDPGEIDAVLLTHAHMDHSGRIPLLARHSFRGKVWATLPTTELVEILWRDSAKLMGEEAEWKTKKNMRKGLPAVEPLYTNVHVDGALDFLSPVSYDEMIQVTPDVAVRFRDAGHILGSAILEVLLEEDGKKVKVVFSGDIGPQKTVMERNPAIITQADYVVIESTYGDRLHRSNLESREEFREVYRKAMGDGGKIYIPSFVVDRAQRILYELSLLQEDGLMKDGVPIFFDSPMGVKVTEIYKKHGSLFSSELQQYLRSGKDPFSPDGLQYVKSVEDSKRTNEIRNAVVIAGSGMVNGGRIVHHLKHGIWDPKNDVVFVGYQAAGTLGRRLVNGEKKLRMAGEKVIVKAGIHTINGFSAHGDRDDLLAWARNYTTSPLFFVTHGEKESAHALSSTLNAEGMRSVVPEAGQMFDLEPGSTSFPVSPAEHSRKGREKKESTGPLLSEMELLLERAVNELPEEGDAALLSLLRSSTILLETAMERWASKERK